MILLRCDRHASFRGHTLEVSITLYTFPVSHFAEKVRWLLDYSGIPYQVVNWVPVIHAPAAYWLSGKRTVHFVVVSDGSKKVTVHDSTQIIEWVHQNFDQLELMPGDEKTYHEAMALEDQADSFGDDVIRYMYAPMLEQPEDFIQVWGWESRKIYRHLLRSGLPAIRMLLDRYLDFSNQGREAGLSRLHDFFASLDLRLEGQQEFLVGDQLSIADISVASLLAPVYAPDTHPVYGSTVFRRSLAAQHAEFSGYASFRWMQHLYGKYRLRRASKTASYRMSQSHS